MLPTTRISCSTFYLIYNAVALIRYLLMPKLNSNDAWVYIILFFTYYKTILFENMI